MLKKNKKGFTLIEIIMVMIILSIIAGMGVYSLARFYELWLFSNYKMELLWGARNVTRDLSTNIRMVRDKNSIYTATATRFIFFNLGSGANTDYQFSNNRLYKNNAQIMPEVSSFAFTYYNCDKNGNCAAPGALSNINTVKIDFTLSNVRESISNQCRVSLRNLY